MRSTPSDRRLLLCLGQEHAADLRRALRGNPTDDARLKQAMVAAMALRPRGHDFALTGRPVIPRHMNVTPQGRNIPTQGNALGSRYFYRPSPERA